MRRAQHDDRSAFAALVRRYESALRRLALNRLGSIEAAEDVVQETFLAAFKSRHTYNEQYSFRTWLWTVLLNQCRRYAGREARAPAAARGAPCDAGSCRVEQDAVDASADASPFSAIVAQERRELLAALLDELSEAQADALRLRFFGGLKFQEIADAMQCSLATAKNRVRAGLLRLSELTRTRDARAEAEPIADRLTPPADQVASRLRMRSDEL